MTTPLSPSGETAVPPARRDRRPVVFGALGAVALSAAGVLLLTGGGDPHAGAAAAPPAAPAGTAVTTTPAAVAAAPAPPAVPDADAGAEPGRDPFQVLHAGARADADGQTATGAAGGPAPVTSAQPTVPSSAAPAERKLVLQEVEIAGEQRTAVFTFDGTGLRAQVGDSFGPDSALVLLSLQQQANGPGWTAVVQSGGGEPFDLTTGTHVHLP